MNFDLITKLAKLANNNPNEAEANSAARKVCKLLAEGEFKFNGYVKEEPRRQGPVGDPYSSPFDSSFIYEYFRQRAAQEQDRQRQRTEEEKRKNYYTGYNYGSWSGFDPSEKQKWYYERGPKEAKIKEDQKWPGGEPFKKPSEQAKEQRLLKCKTCGNTKLSWFVGAAENYVCNTCQWTAYEAKNK